LVHATNDATTAPNRQPMRRVLRGELSVCLPYLGESCHVSFDDVWVRTFQLLDDVEALVELGEDVGN